MHHFLISVKMSPHFNSKTSQAFSRTVLLVTGSDAPVGRATGVSSLCFPDDRSISRKHAVFQVAKE
jgi:hypothetical protein